MFLRVIGAAGSGGDPSEAATRTAASKLGNNAALVVRELAREPSQGLVHVVGHVQKSIPVLVETHQALEAAAEQLQALLTELQDAQAGILSITSPATQQDLASLAASVERMHSSTLAQHQQQQLRLAEAAAGQQQQQQEQPPAGHGAASAGSASRLRAALWGSWTPPPAAAPPES